MKTPAFITILFLTLAAAGFPQSQRIDSETDNLSARYAEYTAYLELVASALESEEQKALRARFQKLKDECIFNSLLLASEGRKKQTALEVTNARIDLAKKQMLSEIGGNNANLSILINRYQESLTHLIQNPPSILLAVLEKNAKEVEEKKD